jgi:hypothetical protein
VKMDYPSDDVLEEHSADTSAIQRTSIMCHKRKINMPDVSHYKPKISLNEAL